MFGQNNKSLFGTTNTSSAFGQPNTSTFGVQSTPTNGPFGGMTANQPQQSSLFGQTAGQPSLFGSPQTSMFGPTPNTATTNTFGAPAATNAFSANTSSLFGGNQQNNSLFGGNRFGQTATTSPFGSGSMATPMAAPNGTTIKFNATNGTDSMMKNGVSQNINTRHQCITCMREYETKSLEELRYEDYMANRKGPQNTGMFGNTATVQTGGGLFGATSTAQNAFNSTANTNLFGQNKTAFGSMAPTTTSSSGLFGQNSFAQNKSMFGSSTSFPSVTTPVSTTSMFGAGAPTNQSLSNNFFSSSATNTSNVRPMFPTAPTQQPSIFGANTTQNTNTLGQKSLFGNPSTSVAPFGQPTSNTLFNTANTSNLFSNSQPNQLFNSTSTAQNKPTNQVFNFNPSSMPSLGNTGLSSTTGLFGNTSNTFGNTGSMFGTTNPTSNFGFGQPNNTFQSNLFQPNTGYQPMPTASPTVNTEQLVTRFQTFPYGDSPQLQIDVTISPNTKLTTKFTTDPKTLNQYRMSGKTSETKPHRIANNSSKINTMLFDGLEDDSADDLKTAKDIFVQRKNVKKLIFTPKVSSSLSDLNASQNTSNTSSNFMIQTQPKFGTKFDDSVATDVTINEFIRNDNKQQMKMTESVEPKQRLAISPSEKGDQQSFHESVSSSHDNSRREIIDNETIAVFIPKCGVILTRTDYYTIPSLEELDTYYEPSIDTCVVPDLTVVRQDYGSIYWKGPLDVKGLNLDEIVHIRRKEVIVYPDEDMAPKVGEGLNRCAQITLDQVWPIDKTTHEVIKDINRLRAMKYPEKIETATIKLGANFKEYRPDTGSWVFTVKHFSKYGLTEDDDDDDIQPIDSLKQTVAKQAMVKKEMVEEKRKLFSKDMDFKESNALEFAEELSTKTLKSRDNALFDNLFDDEEDDDLLDMNSEQSYDYSQQMASEMSEMDKIRFTLFDERETLTTKKSKTFSLISPQKEMKSKFFAPIMPSIARSIPTVKRELTFEADTFGAHNKIICDISLVCVSNSPKLAFFNGSRSFTFIKGSTVLICQLNLIDLNDTVVNRFDELLKNNSNILVSKTATNAPLIETREFAKNSHNSLRQEQLIEALYGPLSEVTSYACHQQRVDRIQSWLYLVNKKLSIPKTSYAKILHFMSTNELEAAVEEALNSNNPRLATLIASGMTSNKELLIAQLDSWKRSKADTFVDYDLMKIYVLMSGLIEWKLSDGKIVTVLEGLHWTQQLALILLYKTLTEVDNNELGLNVLLSAVSNLTVVPDEVEYHLLAGHTPWVTMCWSGSALEAWFLHESLKCYHVMNEDNDLSCLSDSVHTLIASQLQDIRWACFVATHITNDSMRQMAIKEIITRNAYKLMQNKSLEEWLLNAISIPAVYVSEGKAILAKSRFDYYNLALNLIDCHQWSEAHEVLIDRVFPQMIINEENESIAELLSKLKPNSHLISNWFSNGANIYDTYMKCLINSNIEDIKAFNIHQMKTNCKTQILCQSEMARKVNIIYSQLNGGHYAYNTPVPDDYALLELKMNAKTLTKLLC